MSFSIYRPAFTFRNFVAPNRYQPYTPAQPQLPIGGAISGYSAPAFAPGTPMVASPAQYYGGGFAAAPNSVVQNMFQNPSDVQNIMNDPSLTVEDKVALTLMQIMNGMDKEIEGQTNSLNALQTQQGGAGGANKSIDMETTKLQRLVTKRSQMFDTLRQIIDRYNQTAKGVIDSIAR